jgi:hypothetical protein
MQGDRTLPLSHGRSLFRAADLPVWLGAEGWNCGPGRPAQEESGKGQEFAWPNAHQDGRSLSDFGRNRRTAAKRQHLEADAAVIEYTPLESFHGFVMEDPNERR